MHAGVQEEEQGGPDSPGGDGSPGGSGGLLKGGGDLGIGPRPGARLNAPAAKAAQESLMEKAAMKVQ